MKEKKAKDQRSEVGGVGRKVGRRPTFSAGMTTTLEKTRQRFVVLSLIGALAEELRILRQTKGITDGEKEAIGAMLDKLGKFKTYGINCCIMNGGAK